MSRVNEIPRLDFELAYFEVIVQHVSYYSIGNAPVRLSRRPSLVTRSFCTGSVYTLHLFLNINYHIKCF